MLKATQISSILSVSSTIHMRLLCFLVASLICVGFIANAQGNYAGSMKKLIGLKYKDSNSITALKDYSYHEARLISDVNDPEAITVDHFQKGSDVVVFFSIKEDQDDEEFTILDVLEYNNVPQGWQIKTALCRQNEIANVEIVALVKSGTGELLKPAKQAWRFSQDKRRLQTMDKLGVDCIYEGGDD
jgi:hypothetical protein